MAKKLLMTQIKSSSPAGGEKPDELDFLNKAYKHFTKAPPERFVPAGGKEGGDRATK